MGKFEEKQPGSWSRVMSRKPVLPEQQCQHHKMRTNNSSYFTGIEGMVA